MTGSASLRIPRGRGGAGSRTLLSAAHAAESSGGTGGLGIATAPHFRLPTQPKVVEGGEQVKPEIAQQEEKKKGTEETRTQQGQQGVETTKDKCCVSPHILLLWDYLLINVSQSVIYFLSVTYIRQSVVIRGAIVY